MQRLSTIIIDDESRACKVLARQLSEHCPELTLAGMATSAGEGFSLINKTKPDLVFLDIEMPNGNGFDLLKKFDAINFRVIFVTAYDHYAIQAIQFSALDYLLKPISGTRLRDAVNRLQGPHPEQMGQVLEDVKDHQTSRKIAIPDRQGVTFVELSEIIRCRADRNYTTFFLTNGEKILSSRPLNNYDELLADYNFLRIHNSHLVNMMHICRYIKGEPGIAVMTDKSEVEISRRKKGELLERLALWPALRP